MAYPVPARKRRPWWKAGIALAVLFVAGVAALPWFLGTPPARRWLLARVNRALGPGKLDVESFRFSWFGPTRMTGLALTDASGKRVIVAERATWDRDLGRLLFDRPRFGTFALDQAALDLERRRDGTIDLVDALRPIFGNNPRKDLTIRISHGRLRFNDPALARPIIAERADLMLKLPPAPKPIDWRLQLAHGPDALEILGQFDRWGRSADLDLSVSARRWPLAVDVAGIVADVKLDGKGDLDRRANHWQLAGNAALLDIDAHGRVLAGDRLRLDRVGGTWDLVQGPGGWTVRRLDLSSSLASLRTKGPWPAPLARIEGRIDLAGLASQLPHALRLRDGLTLDRGSARLDIVSKDVPGGKDWDVKALISDLVASQSGRAFTLHDPATLSAQINDRNGRFHVERLAVETPFLKADGRGDLARGVDVTGSVDLANLKRQAGDLIDFGGLELAGQGSLSARYHTLGPTFEGVLSIDLGGVRVAGLTSEPIARDAVHLGATVSGPSGGSGLPMSWELAQLDVKAGDVAAKVMVTMFDGRMARSDGRPVGISVSGSAPSRPDEPPFSLQLAGSYRGDSDQLDVARLDLAGPYARLGAKGHVGDLSKRSVVDLEGSFTPDWDAINRALVDRVEPKAKMNGSAQPFHLRGPLRGGTGDDILKGLDARIGFVLDEADVYGMRIGRAPIILTSKDGQIRFEPIETTLNNGRLRLLPEIRRDEHGTMLRLLPGSAVEEAEVNDEVSRRVLAYVAPVLDSATRAHGRVSAEFERAEFPIGEGEDRHATVEGRVVFQDVEFAPGPLAEGLLDLIGRQYAPTLKLNEPVVLSISDGRVHQHGLAIPVGQVTRIELDGTVDFDKNLDLTARLPITPAMVGNNPLLGEIAAGTHFDVPIGGTLGKPKIDREAFTTGMKDLGKSLLARGAAGLLLRMARPRDPAEAPPAPRLSPEERRERRLERKAERRRNRLP